MAFNTIEPNNELLPDRNEVLRDRLLDSRYKASLFYSAYCEEASSCPEDVTPAQLHNALLVQHWVQTADDIKAEIERRGGTVDNWPARLGPDRVAKWVHDMDALIASEEAATKTGSGLVH